MVVGERGDGNVTAPGLRSAPVVTAERHGALLVSWGKGAGLCRMCNALRIRMLGNHRTLWNFKAFA